jgi:hypothetical protein
MELRNKKKSISIFSETVKDGVMKFFRDDIHLDCSVGLGVEHVGHPFWSSLEVGKNQNFQS